MPLSAYEQQYIQDMVDAASSEERSEMCFNAETTLFQLDRAMGPMALSKEENKAFDLAIETLMRVEATEKGKGWWFRTKRRAQLIIKYLG